MKHRLPFLLIVLAVIGVVVWFCHSQPGKTETAHLVLHGNVDIREVNLGFRVSGRVTEVLRDEGSPVAPGEAIARLDAAPYKQELAQAEADLAVAQANLQHLASGYRREEIAQARAQVNQIAAVLENSRSTAERTRRLLEKNASSQQAYDDARTAVATAEKQLDFAKASLDLMLSGYRAEDIAKARAQVARAAAALEVARIRLSDTTLAAPSSGTIMTRVLEPGAIVQAGATVFTLSLDKPVWLRAYVNEPDLGKIHPGMSVEILTDSRPGKPYKGTVGHISPRAEFTPKTVQTEHLRATLVYRIRVTVENPDNMLRQGMPVTIRAVLPLSPK
ncbi:MAG: secretion protein HlyD [Puniceicoccales bacterium]|jgi:HlyD family secretion protein|nr:secretion protein HlyD [Puniceicoccales bacterium]